MNLNCERMAFRHFAGALAALALAAILQLAAEDAGAAMATASWRMAQSSGDSQFSGATSGLGAREREFGLALGVVIQTMR